MSEFVKVKTVDLVGAALDWAVAEIDEVKTIMLSPRGREPKKAFALFGSLALPIGDGEQGYAPSTCWHCGGPLIEKYRVGFVIYPDDYFAVTGLKDSSGSCDGQTHLIAACRAIVASVLGETISVPKELMP